MPPLLLEGRKKIEISNRCTLDDAIRFWTSTSNKKCVKIHLSIRKRERFCQECHHLNEEPFLDFIKLVATTSSDTGGSTSAQSTIKQIVSIHIDPTMIERTLGSATMQQVSEVLGRIPTLRFLTWDVNPQVAQLEYGLPVDCLRNLAQVLQNARHLESLRCNGVWFGGTSRDFATLAKSLSGHPTLNMISFQNCHLSDERQTLDDVNPMLLAFSNIPRLQLLKLGCWAVPSLYTPIQEIPAGGAAEKPHLYPLTKIFGNAALRSVHIHSDALICAASVKDCMRIKHLKLTSVEFESTECQFVADILSSSNQTLETLELSLAAETLESDIASHASGVIQALRTNTSLKGLRFSCIRLGPSGNGLAFVSMLQATLVSVLENDNTTLCYVEFSGVSFSGMDNQQVEMQNTMDHYLKLNELGRGELFAMYNSNTQHQQQSNDIEHQSIATAKKWVDALIAAKGDVPVLYYFLSQNPSLCCHWQKHAADNQTTARRCCSENEEHSGLRVVGNVGLPTKRRRM